MPVQIQSKEDVMKRYLDIYKLYKNTGKDIILVEIEECLMSGELDKASLLLDKLVDKNTLVQGLIDKLKGKPVYDTLKDITSGKCTSKYTALKGLFSLGVHTCIELEKGNMEYVNILNDVFLTIQRRLYHE